MRIGIQNVKLVQNGTVTPCDLLLNNDRVEEIVPVGGLEPGLKTVSADGLYLSHGFIDIHLHGGGGASAPRNHLHDADDSIRNHGGADACL